MTLLEAPEKRENPSCGVAFERAAGLISWNEVISIFLMEVRTI
jgi:hypothetical protein